MKRCKNTLWIWFLATRKPKDYGFKELEDWIEIGASPRATVGFPKAAKALAWLEGRSFVSLDDIKRLSPAILKTSNHSLL